VATTQKPEAREHYDRHRRVATRRRLHESQAPRNGTRVCQSGTYATRTQYGRQSGYRLAADEHRHPACNQVGIQVVGRTEPMKRRSLLSLIFTPLLSLVGRKPKQTNLDKESWYTLWIVPYKSGVETRFIPCGQDPPKGSMSMGHLCTDDRSDIRPFRMYGDAFPHKTMSED